MPNPHEPWTGEEDYLLHAMKAAAKGAPVIAKELKRTEQSIISRTAILKQRQGRSKAASVGGLFHWSVSSEISVVSAKISLSSSSFFISRSISFTPILPVTINRKLRVGLNYHF
jgi:hypothetical protein